MNKNAKYLIRNITYTILSNGVNLVMSILVAFIVPKLLGVKEYSYWQLYAFYASYVGFFHFGWADGIYLRFGGQRYENLDRSYFATQFWLLVCLEILIALGIAIFSLLFVADTDKKYIIIMTGVCCIVQIPRTLLQYLLQTTNRIDSFAKNAILEKGIYAVGVMFILLFGIRQYKPLLFVDLLARGVTLILLCITCKDIILAPISNIMSGLQDALLNINIGIKLMFGNIASLLITGIMRFAIERNWDIETFGKVSLTMAVSNMIMVFVSAIGIVMYPLLRNISEEKMRMLYEQIRSVLMLVVLGLLVFYYPGKLLLSKWLPQYAESLNYMALLFPICIFESKMSMLINTYLKALRKEKVIFIGNWTTVAVSFICVFLFCYRLHNLTLSIASITFLSGLKCFILETVLSKELQIHVLRKTIVEIILVLMFILSGWNINTWLCTIVYTLAYVTYLFIHRKHLALMAGYIAKH